MADNTTINRGTDGDTIATDDISGVKHQLVKMEFGESDTATQVSSDDPLPVSQAAEGTAFLREVASQFVLENILSELQRINVHLSIISSNKIELGEF